MDINYKKEFQVIVDFIESVINPIDSTFKVDQEFKQKWLDKLQQTYTEMNSKHQNNKVLFRQQYVKYLNTELDIIYQELLKQVNQYFKDGSNNTKQLFKMKDKLEQEIKDLDIKATEVNKSKDYVIEQFKRVISVKGFIYQTDISVEQLQDKLSQFQQQIDQIKAKKQELVMQLEKMQMAIKLTDAVYGDLVKEKNNIIIQTKQLIKQNKTNDEILKSRYEELRKLMTSFKSISEIYRNKNLEMIAKYQEIKSVNDDMDKLKLISKQQLEKMDIAQSDIDNKARIIQQQEDQIKNITNLIKDLQLKKEKQQIANQDTVKQQQQIQDNWQRLQDMKEQFIIKQKEFEEYKEDINKQIDYQRELKDIMDNLQEQEEQLQDQIEKNKQMSIDALKYQDTTQQQIDEIEQKRLLLDSKQKDIDSFKQRHQELVKQQIELQELNDNKLKEIQDILLDIDRQLEESKLKDAELSKSVIRTLPDTNKDLNDQLLILQEKLTRIIAENQDKSIQIDKRIKEALDEQQSLDHQQEQLLLQIQEAKDKYQQLQKEQELALNNQKTTLADIKNKNLQTMKQLESDKELLRKQGLPVADDTQIELLNKANKLINDQQDIMNELQQKHKQYQEVYQQLQNQLKKNSEIVQRIVDNIIPNLADSEQHTIFKQKLNSILQQIKNSNDVDTQTIGMMEISKLIQEIEEALISSHGVISAIIQGMLNTQINISNNDKSTVNKLIMDKIRILEALFTGQPSMLADTDITKPEYKQSMIKDMLDVYKKQVFYILQQIRDIQKYNQQLAFILDKSYNLTDAELKELKPLIANFKKDLESQQSELIIKLFQIFHLFVIPINIFKATPLRKDASIEASFIKYIKANIESGEKNINIMKDLKVDTSNLKKQVDYQKKLISDIEGKFKTDFFKLKTLDRMAVNAGIQQFINNTIEKSELIAHMIRNIKSKRTGTDDDAKLKKYIEEFKKYSNSPSILQDKEYLKDAGLDINKLTKYVNEMIVASLNQLIKDKSPNWFNIVENTITIIPQLFNYTFFIMTTILDIIVSEEASSMTIDNDYLKLLRNNFTIQLDKYIQDDIAFQANESVIFDKIDQILQNKKDKKQLVDLVHHVTQYNGQNLFEHMNKLVNTISTTSKLVKQLDKHINQVPNTRVDGTGKQNQRSQLISLIFDVTSRIQVY